MRRINTRRPDRSNDKSFAETLNTPFLLEGKLNPKEHKFLDRLRSWDETVTLADYQKVIGIFRPSVLIFLINSGANDILRKYLRAYEHWRHKASLPKLIIHPKWLQQYFVGCNCRDCMGKCLKIAVKHRVLQTDAWWDTLKSYPESNAMTHRMMECSQD